MTAAVPSCDGCRCALRIDEPLLPAANFLSSAGGVAWDSCFTPLRGMDFPVATMIGFNGAVTSAQPGDTITLADGSWSNADLLFKANGTVTQPITLRAQTSGRVFLSGASRLRIVGS